MWKYKNFEHYTDYHAIKSSPDTIINTDKNITRECKPGCRNVLFNL